MAVKAIVVGSAIIVAGTGAVALCRWLFRSLVRTIVDEVRRQLNGGNGHGRHP